MTAIAEEWKLKLAELPVQDGAALAHFLIGSLDDETDADAEALWDTELARRGAEIRLGTAKGEPADEVFARLFEKYS